MAKKKKYKKKSKFKMFPLTCYNERFDVFYFFNSMIIYNLSIVLIVIF
jgi:hypothetical protein